MFRDQLAPVKHLMCSEFSHRLTSSASSDEVDLSTPLVLNNSSCWNVKPPTSHQLSPNIARLPVKAMCHVVSVATLHYCVMVAIGNAEV